MSQQRPIQDAWTRARDRFVEDLTEEEKQLYYKGSLEMIYYDASAAQKRHEGLSTTKHLVDKLQPLVSAIDQYAEALDVYSNAYPLALSPLWGSLRIVLHLAREFGKYFEKLLDMFEQIGQVLPRFRAYERLFPNNERLIQLISVVYVDILAFCSDVKSQFRHGKRAAKINLKILSKMIWKPIDVQFANYMRKFKDHEETVEKEAKLCEMIESAESRALVLANRLQLEKERQEQERQTMLSTLCVVSNKELHLKQRRMCHEGTGLWALQSSQYLEWKAQRGHQALCCYAGCGKSVLVSTIVEDLLGDEASRQHVLYYYCSHADARSLDARQVLGSFLKQLFLDGILPSAAQQELLTILGQNEGNDREEKLAKMLKSAISSHRVTFLIIDGLDECKEETQKYLIKFLTELLKCDAFKGRILLTCRDESQTLSAIGHWPSIQLSESAICDDLRRFVSHSVRSSLDNGDLKISDASLEQEIVTVLTTKAHGMFLWVHFQLIELCTAIAPSQIRAALQSLPDGLGDTYERILRRIGGSKLHWTVAKRIFNWLACARRPLKLEEMQEAVAFDGSDKAWDADKIPARSSLLKICQGLVVQAPDNGMVQFAHYTVQQYLFADSLSLIGISGHSILGDESHHHCLSMEDAHADAADLCITYLNFSDFETALTSRVQDTRFAHSSILGPGGPGAIAGSIGLGKPVFNVIYRVMGRSTRPAALDIDYAKYLNLPPKSTAAPQDGKHDFLGYIIENWIWHIRFPSKITPARYYKILVEKTLPFEFRPWGPNRHFGPYGCNFCSSELPRPKQPKDLILTPMIHWAAADGNTHLLEYLKRFDFSDGIDLYWYLYHESYTKETMVLACRMGHTNVVEFLLNLYHQLCWDSSLLVITTSAGHTETLDALRRHNIEEFQSQVDILLFKAATNGHASVVRYLVGHGANFDFRDDLANMTPFESAVANSREEVIRSLAQSGVDIDQRDLSGATALHRTVQQGNVSMTTCLVECGASFQSKYQMDKTPLDLAIIAGHAAVTEYLLARPLYRAQLGNHEMFEDPHKMRVDWECVPYRKLLWVAAFGHEESLKITFDQIDAWDNGLVDDFGEGLSLLHIAAYHDNVRAVREILSRGLSPNRETNSSCTPLHFAAHRGSLDAMEELLCRKAYQDHRTVHGWSPLHFVASSLARHGLTTKTRASIGKFEQETPGHHNCLKMLLEFGANPNASTNIDQGAMTALHILVSSDFHSLDQAASFSDLVNSGVDLKLRNQAGDTAFELAENRAWNFKGALLFAEVDSKDRPLLWHVKDTLIHCVNADLSEFAFMSPYLGVQISDYISKGTFNDHDVIYARKLVKFAREAIENGISPDRRRTLELVIFLLDQTTGVGNMKLKLIPSSDSLTRSPAMGQPPNTPVTV